MTSTLDARQFQAELQRLDALLREVERFTDPAAQAHVRQLVQAILSLHGAGLERLLAHLEDAGAAGTAVLDACARDDIISGLLLLHGLHPLSLEERVRLALDQVAPYLRGHGGNVALLGVNDGVVRLRLEGSCDGCPSTAVTMKQTIEEVILGRAPDVVAIEVENDVAVPLSPVHGSSRVALPLLH